jgi:hypothetical protein
MPIENETSDKALPASPLSTEGLIFNQLLHNQEFFYKVFPFLSESYFEEGNKVLFRTFKYHFDKYDKPASKEILDVYLSNNKHINESLFKAAINTLNEIKDPIVVEYEPLLDIAEKFCQDKSLYNALAKSVSIFDKETPENPKSSIPELLNEALGVTFNTDIGTDYIDDAKKRFERLNKKHSKIPFRIDILNDITDGGFELKTVNVFLASCVTEDTKVKIRNIKIIDELERRFYVLHVEIKDLKNLLINGEDFEIWTPDGWQKVGAYIEKGKKKIYSITCQGVTTRAAGKHLFETKNGWEYTEDLAGKENFFLCDDDLFHRGYVEDKGEFENVVDIEILHEKHRYFTNNISSHNTGVGKSAIKCALSADYALEKHDVLYLTMEMAEEKIAQRLDANLFNKTLSQVKNMAEDEFMTNIDYIAKKGMGKIIVKEYPTVGVHMGHIESLLRELKLKKKFIPKIVCLDYLNICLSKRVGIGAGSYMFVKAIIEEFRGLAVKYNFCGITSTQGDRSTIESSDIGLQNVSESKGINDTADFVLGLMAPEDVKAQGLLLCKQLKSRYGDVNRKRRFALLFDSEKMIIEDSDNVVVPGFNGDKEEAAMSEVSQFDKSTGGRYLSEGDKVKNLFDKKGTDSIKF